MDAKTLTSLVTASTGSMVFRLITKTSSDLTDG